MIYTSYFAKQKSAPNTIAICRGVPKWYTGPIYQDLAPTWSILNEWNNSDKGLFAQQRYVARYYEEVLSRLNPKKIQEDLNDKILLCYEKSDAFCHRHIIREWLRENGCLCEEIK